MHKCSFVVEWDAASPCSCSDIELQRNRPHISSDWEVKIRSLVTLYPHFSSVPLPSFLQVIQDIFKKLCYAFHIFPQFNFGNGLMKLARMNIEVQILSGYGIDAYINPFSLDALGWMMISSFFQGLVFFVLRLLLNKSLLRKVRWGKRKNDDDHDRERSWTSAVNIQCCNQVESMMNALNLEMRSVSFGPLLRIIFRHIQDFCSLLKDDTVPGIS